MMEMTRRPAFTQAGLLEEEQPAFGVLAGDFVGNLVRASDRPLLLESIHAAFHANNASGCFRCGRLPKADQRHDGSFQECAPFHVFHLRSSPHRSTAASIAACTPATDHPIYFVSAYGAFENCQADPSAERLN